MPSARPKVLLIYADRVAERMGGVGIRALELARALAPEADVTIAAAETDGTDHGVPVVLFSPHAPHALRAPLRDTDAVIGQPQWPATMRLLAASRARLIFDLYDPEAFGTLEHFAARRPAVRGTMGAYAVDRLRAALRLGHHIACAGERQRDLWLGAMLASRLITPALTDADPGLRSVIDTVPFGVPEAPPDAAGTIGPRERFGLGPEAEIVLWNGGLWSWFDPETAIRAMVALRERRPQAHLVFMGGSSAPPAVAATQRARQVAEALGLLDSGVRFHDAWVPYGERGAWLAQAACLVSTHAPHLEARFAYRTRLLDGFWAGVPIVCTEGDEIGDRVGREGLGETVPPGDAEALAGALDAVLTRGHEPYRAALARAAEGQRWSRVVAPLRRWIHDPPRAGRRRRAPLGAREPGERVRTAAYLAATTVLGALGVPAPRLRR